MKRLAVSLTALLLLLSACGSGDDTPSSTPSPTASPSATPTPTAAEDLVITPGRIGDAKAGMHLDDALSTGYFELTKPAADPEPCETNLHWKPAYKNFDLFINIDDDVRELGVTGSGAKTSYGIAVGDTYRQLQTEYVRLSAPKAIDGNRTGAFYNEGPSWIGFAFAEPPAKLKATSKIAYIQVGSENEPSLNPADC
jgi:hypothetical protein